MDNASPFAPDLYDLYLDGETLIIELQGYRRTDEGWVRDEVHSIVGYDSEHHTVRCLGPYDVSEDMGPPDEPECDICAQCKVHTLDLHLSRLKSERFKNLEL